MNVRPIAVLGPYRGGTSLVTGILRELGCFAGEHFFHAYTGYCTYEAKFLRRCCTQCFDENEGHWRFLLEFEQRVNVLRQWIQWAVQEACSQGHPAVVGKHPLMCKLVDELSLAWQLEGIEPPLFVSVQRPLEDVMSSWDRARTPHGNPWWPRTDRTEIVADLIMTRDQSLEHIHSVSVDFALLRANPNREVANLAKSCGLSENRVDDATKLVRKPNNAYQRNGNREDNSSRDAQVAARLDQHRSRLSGDIRHAQVIRKLPRPSNREIICSMVVFNEELRLPDTLRHYRKLGVDRFTIIDNGSNDRTNEFLLEQPDVDVFLMPLPYETSVGGAGWISALIHEFYGPNRWVLWSDADEQLVYDGWEQHNLHELANLLGRFGQSALPSVMVDFYSNLSIAETDLSIDQEMLACCPFFDGEGYNRVVVDGPGTIPRIVWSGGPNERAFAGEPGWLAKTPFAYWTAETWYWNPHVIYPFQGNFGAATAAQLHFKFLSDFPSLVDREVDRNQHADQAKKYRNFQQNLRTGETECLMYDHSVRYENPKSLINANLISPIDWG